MSKIDVFEAAIAIDAGEPQEITLRGHDLTIRRNFSADEVHEFIRLYSAEAENEPVDELLKKLIDLISTSAPAAKEAFIEDMLSLTVPEFQKVQILLGKIAGIRGEDGNFLTGSPS